MIDTLAFVVLPRFAVISRLAFDIKSRLLVSKRFSQSGVCFIQIFRCCLAEMSQHQLADSLMIEISVFCASADEALRGKPLECGCCISAQRLTKDVTIKLSRDSGEQCSLPAIFLRNPL